MDFQERVKACVGDDLVSMTEFRGDVSVTVPRTRIVQVLTRLKEAEGLKFDFLSDLFGVDNSALGKGKKKGKKEEEEAPAAPKPPRYEVVYLLLSLEYNHRLMVKVQVEEGQMEVPTVTSIWKAANWPEREVFDMFGIRFKGHPNMKRLLMWDGFPAHPLRKDYPLEGEGEERRLVYGDT